MIVKISELKYSYKANATYQLRNLNLDFDSGKIYGILGHNGAGKTTLFKLIIGFLKPTFGKIMINSTIICDKREISFLSDTNAIYEDLTVLENIHFRRKLSTNPASDSDIAALIKKYKLSDQVNLLTKTLSQGQKKRVAIICCLINKPKLFILDEPTNAIDPQTFALLASELIELRSRGTSILVSSHSVEFVHRIADEILILNQGTLVYQSSLENISLDELDSLYLRHTDEDGGDSDDSCDF